MDVEAGSLRQPGLRFGVLVSAVVVDDQVQIELLWHLLIDPSQDAQEHLVPVSGLAFGDYRTGGPIQCGEQGGGAVADGVMRHPLPVVQSHGQ